MTLCSGYRVYLYWTYLCICAKPALSALLIFCEATQLSELCIDTVLGNLHPHGILRSQIMGHVTRRHRHELRVPSGPVGLLGAEHLIEICEGRQEMREC